MSWLSTIPKNTRDPKKKIYIHYYDASRKSNWKKVTQFSNTQEGWKKAREFKKRFDVYLLDGKNLGSLESKLQPITLQNAFQNFLTTRNIKKASIEMYELSFAHFIKAIGDKPVHQVSEENYNSFIKYLKDQKLSENSRSTYSKHLSVIWKYFIEQKFTDKKIVKIIKPVSIPPRSIPDKDLKTIFKYFKKKNRQRRVSPKAEDKLHYNCLMILYLTGWRISTLIELKEEQIDWKNKLIYYKNVKGNKIAAFPLHSELEKILSSMKLKPGQKVVPYTNRQSFCFWKRALKNLKLKYTIHQLRKTLATTFVNNQLSIYDTQTALDHSDIKTTQKYYALANIQRIRKDINKYIKFVKV